MVEKIDVSQTIEYDKDPNVENSVENLVLQLGVPAGRAQRCIEALYVAFGKENQPTQRIIEFLTFKISGKA